MAMKMILAGALLTAGWLWGYLFLRQFLFNLTVAYPMIESLNKHEELIAVGAKRYTTISVVVCIVMSALLLFLAVRFLPLYLLICFTVGGAFCLVMLLGGMKPSNRAMFDIFCGAYYRFVPDDELRTAMYNKKPSRMKQRLHNMGISIDCIPEFDKK